MIPKDKTSLRQNYDENIKQEAAFWEHECGRPQAPCNNPYCIWDDPKVEQIMRGKYQQFIIDKAAEKSDNRVLEMGCGHGWLSLAIAKKGIWVDGFDIGPSLIGMAKEKSKEYLTLPSFRPPNFEIRDLNKIVLEPATYDVVIFWDSLHHILEAERLLVEIHKTLKKGGSLVMIDHVREPTVRGQFLADIWMLIVPMDTPYILRFKELFHKIRGGFSNVKPQIPPPIVSPFEDITGIEMIDYIEKYFHVRKKIFLLSFSHLFAARIRARESLRLPLIRFLKWLDEFLIRTHILKGEYVSIWAVKE